MHTFQGTLTALVTPMRDGRIDLAALETLIARQVEAGVDGLVPCGTTGESPTLSEDEQLEVIRATSRLARGKAKIVAGAGSNDTRHAIELSRRAADAGVDGLLQVNPYYNRPTQRGLFEHFRAIASAVPLPIMLYNIPGRTGVTLEVATIAALRRECANVVAVKHATGRVDDAAELLADCDITLLSGDDPLTLPLMSLGAVGVVSVLSNLAPRMVKRLTDAALAGDFVQARREHAALFALARGLLSLETNPIPIKTALAMKGLCREEFRLPMCPISDENREKLRRLLERVDAS